MTVPAQRGNAEDSTVLGMVLDGVREVKESVQRMQTDINTRLDGLDQKYVPRQEIDARFSESQRDRQNIHTLIAEHKARHDADVIRLSASNTALEEKLTAARRYALTTSIAGFLAVVGLLSLILNGLL